MSLKLKCDESLHLTWGGRNTPHFVELYSIDLLITKNEKLIPFCGRVLLLHCSTTTITTPLIHCMITITYYNRNKNWNFHTNWDTSHSKKICAYAGATSQKISPFPVHLTSFTFIFDYSTHMLSWVFQYFSAPPIACNLVSSTNWTIIKSNRNYNLIPKIVTNRANSNIEPNQ